MYSQLEPKTDFLMHMRIEVVENCLEGVLCSTIKYFSIGAF
jgi:hypothetical protein